MALEKLRAALATQKSTQPILLARAEPQENNKIFEKNNLRKFEEIPDNAINNFQTHQALLTYASRKSKKITRC
jgi:hypothetical protein